MLESLLTLLFLFLLISWFTQILLMWTQDERQQMPMVYHFHHVIEVEAQTAISIEVKNNQLYFIQTNGDIVTISFHNNKIRRQVNGSGNEEILRNIQDFNLTEGENNIAVQLTTDSGEQIEKWLFKKVQK
ncbi:ComGF family competence protein [Gracilibacillus sp. D59]|uniref:ComGF family competence protein n=1 Tax=Gracilibacillus sp. D59 TaxID=3457434 RepID=UPI003FCD05DF